MRELFREADFTIVGHFRSILEDAGIQTMIRNEALSMSGLTEIPIPDMFPALCVVHDEDFERARAIIFEHIKRDEGKSDEEVNCPSCGESNPGNFEVCWACEASLRSDESTDEGA